MITNQGQVSIPVKVRKLLGIKPSSTLKIDVKNNEIVLKPVLDIESLGGALNKYAIKEKDIRNVIVHEKDAYKEAVIDGYKRKKHGK